MDSFATAVSLALQYGVPLRVLCDKFSHTRFEPSGWSGNPKIGYSDEWTDDGVLLYTGEGQHGDMRFVGGNRAIRDHLKDGKALQVFEQDKKDKRFLRYLGEMEYAQHAYREAPDTDGKQRKAIVFHLRPVGTLSPDSALVAAALAGEGGSLKGQRVRFRRNQPASGKGSH
jgi:hypothetical protein